MLRRLVAFGSSLRRRRGVKTALGLAVVGFGTFALHPWVAYTTRRFFGCGTGFCPGPGNGTRCRCPINDTKTSIVSQKAAAAKVIYDVHPLLMQPSTFKEIRVTRDLVAYLDLHFPPPGWWYDYSSSLVKFMRERDIKLVGSFVIAMALKNDAGFVPANLNFVAGSKEDAGDLIAYLLKHGYDNVHVSAYDSDHNPRTWCLLHCKSRSPMIYVNVSTVETQQTVGHAQRHHPKEPYLSFSDLAFDGWHTYIRGYSVFDKSGCLVGEGSIKAYNLVRKWKNRGFNVTLTDEQTKSFQMLEASSSATVKITLTMDRKL